MGLVKRLLLASGKITNNKEYKQWLKNNVIRWHKTTPKNAKSIDGEGLTRQNENYGQNTGDTDEYPNVLWFATKPTDIPVLRRYRESPSSTTLYNVSFPTDYYKQTPRVKFANGRGGEPVF